MSHARKSCITYGLDRRNIQGRKLCNSIIHGLNNWAQYEEHGCRPVTRILCGGGGGGGNEAKTDPTTELYFL